MAPITRLAMDRSQLIPGCVRLLLTDEEKRIEILSIVPEARASVSDLLANGERRSNGMVSMAYHETVRAMNSRIEDLAAWATIHAAEVESSGRAHRESVHAHAIQARKHTRKLTQEELARRKEGASIHPPGDALAWIIKKITGTEPAPTCACNARRRQMNAWGWKGCFSNRAQIIEWISDEARKRGHSIGRLTAVGLFLAAVREIRR